MFLAAFNGRPKIHVEFLAAFIAALRPDVRRVVHHNPEFAGGHADHLAVVSDDHRLVLRVDIHRDDVALRAFPESTGVKRRVQDRLRWYARIEVEHRFEQVPVAALPDATDGLICSVRGKLAVRCERTGALDQGQLPRLRHPPPRALLCGGRALPCRCHCSGFSTGFQKIDSIAPGLAAASRSGPLCDR